MAKREFPANKGIRARIEAIISSETTCRSVLENVRMVLDKLPPGIAEVLGAQIDRALAKSEVALQAIAGEDEP